MKNAAAAQENTISHLVWWFSLFHILWFPFFVLVAGLYPKNASYLVNFRIIFTRIFFFNGQFVGCLGFWNLPKPWRMDDLSHWRINCSICNRIWFGMRGKTREETPRLYNYTVSDITMWYYMWCIDIRRLSQSTLVTQQFANMLRKWVGDGRGAYEKVDTFAPRSQGFGEVPWKCLHPWGKYSLFKIVGKMRINNGERSFFLGDVMINNGCNKKKM